MRRKLAPAALVAALWLALPATTPACPSCKEAVASQEDGEAERVARGYSWSILLMIGVPVALVGSGVFFVSRAVRRGAIPEL